MQKVALAYLNLSLKCHVRVPVLVDLNPQLTLKVLCIRCPQALMFSRQVLEFNSLLLFSSHDEFFVEALLPLTCFLHLV